MCLFMGGEYLNTTFVPLQPPQAILILFEVGYSNKIPNSAMHNFGKSGGASNNLFPPGLLLNMPEEYFQ